MFIDQPQPTEAGNAAETNFDTNLLNPPRRVNIDRPQLLARFALVPAVLEERRLNPISKDDLNRCQFVIIVQAFKVDATHGCFLAPQSHLIEFEHHRKPLFVWTNLLTEL